MQHNLSKKNKGFLAILISAVLFMGAADVYMFSKGSTDGLAGKKGVVEKKGVSEVKEEAAVAQADVCTQGQGNNYLFVGCNGFF